MNIFHLVEPTLQADKFTLAKQTIPALKVSSA